MSNPTPDDVPALTDIQVGEETVFVESPEHVAARTSAVQDTMDEAHLRKSANSLKGLHLPVEEIERRREKVLSSEDDLVRLRTATGQLYTDQPSVAFHEQAILAVQVENHRSGGLAPATSDLFVVWFTKVLGNWKALVGQKSSTNYYEVTFNGAKQEAYVDRYAKQSNTVIPANLIEIRV